MKLEVKIARRPHGEYRAWVPALPGCVVLGDTQEEARAKIALAANGYLASLNVALPRELAAMKAKAGERDANRFAWSNEPQTAA